MLRQLPLNNIQELMKNPVDRIDESREIGSSAIEEPLQRTRSVDPLDSRYFNIMIPNVDF